MARINCTCSEDQLHYVGCDCGAEEAPAFWCVSIYLCDRAYGGPEEGGWWYGCGDPVLDAAEHTRIFTNLDAARAYRNRLEVEVVDALNEGRRSIDSVLSEGQYAAVVDWGHYPQHYPQHRPHYE